MVALRLVLILSALVASAHGHTRGAANLEDADTIGTSHHRGLGMNKDKKKKNLAGTNPSKGSPSGSNVRPQQNGGINGGIVRPQNGKQSMGGKNGGNNKDRKPNNSGGGDNTGGGIYVAEEHDCVPFNDEMQARASLSLSDDACRTNECGGGCCRVYHWLICDTGDEMPQLSCVCNANTRPISTSPPIPAPTPSPTLGATTLAPVVPATPNPTLAPVPATPAPTPQVTSSVREPGPDVQVPAPTPVAASGHNPAPQAQNPPPQAQNPPPQANNPTVGSPPFVGGAPADSCTSGSPHHNNPLFRGFTKCFAGDDCPLASECCIHSFCFCGEPDDWTGDCVAQIQK